MLEKLRHLAALIKKEALTILRDPKSRIIIIAPPLIQLALFANILTMETKNADIAVVDGSQTLESREFIAGIENSRWFGEVIRTSNPEQAQSDLKNEKIQGIIIIRQDFARRLKKGQTADVQLILDGRTPTVATGVNGYVQQIAAAYSQKLARKSGATGATISLSSRTWFNPNAVYQWYLVISLAVILALIITLMLTALSVARERELGTFEQLIVSPYTAFEILVGKTVPPLVIALALQSAMTLAAVVFFEIPFTGSFVLFLSSSFIALLSFVGVGLFISSVCNSQQQAILGAFAFMMPAVLLSGFVSPVEDMPVFLQYLTWANPMRFFIKIGNGLFLKNLSFTDVWPDLLPLIAIAAVTLAFAARTFKRNLE